MLIFIEKLMVRFASSKCVDRFHITFAMLSLLFADDMCVFQYITRISDFARAVIIQCAKGPEDEDRRHDDAEVTHTVGDHRLTACVTVLPTDGAGLIPPEADEQVRHQTDAFPTHKHHQEVIARHQDQHEHHEHIEEGEEATVLRIAVHVTYGVDVDQAADTRHHQQHDRR